MNTIGDRVSALIKELKINRSQFAKDLGITPSAVSKLCQGDNIPATSTIKSICRTYNVNEEWLTEGKGEMFAELPEETELGYILGVALKDERAPHRLDLLRAIAEAPPEEIDAITAFARRLMKQFGIKEDK